MEEFIKMHGNFVRGEKVTLQIRKEDEDYMIHGTFEKIDDKSVVLFKPINVNKQVLGKYRNFSINDIKRVIPDNQEIHDEVVYVSTSEKSTLSKPHSTFVTIPYKHMEAIQEMARSFVYIHQTDVDYHKAIDEIKKSNIVALSTEVRYERLKSPNLIGIAIPNKVFVFYVRFYEKHFIEDIRSILTDRAYTKVFFESQWILDYFVKQYEINVLEVCDLRLIFSMKLNKDVVDFKECIQQVFGINTFMSNEYDCNNQETQEGELNKFAMKMTYLLKTFMYLNSMKTVDFHKREHKSLTSIVNQQISRYIEEAENDGKIKKILQNLK